MLQPQIEHDVALSHLNQQAYETRSPRATWRWKRYGPTVISFDALPPCDAHSHRLTDGRTDRHAAYTYVAL